MLSKLYVTCVSKVCLDIYIIIYKLYKLFLLHTITDQLFKHETKHFQKELTEMVGSSKPTYFSQFLPICKYCPE